MAVQRLLQAAERVESAVEPLGAPVRVQRVLRHQPRVRRIAVQRAAQALGDGGGVGQWFAPGVLGPRHRLRQRPHRMSMPIHRVLHDRVRQRMRPHRRHRPQHRIRVVHIHDEKIAHRRRVRLHVPTRHRHRPPLPPDPLRQPVRRIRPQRQPQLVPLCHRQLHTHALIIPVRPSGEVRTRRKIQSESRKPSQMVPAHPPLVRAGSLQSTPRRPSQMVQLPLPGTTTYPRLPDRPRPPRSSRGEDPEDPRAYTHTSAMPQIRTPGHRTPVRVGPGIGAAGPGQRRTPGRSAPGVLSPVSPPPLTSRQARCPPTRSAGPRRCGPSAVPPPRCVGQDAEPCLPHRAQRARSRHLPATLHHRSRAPAGRDPGGP